MCNLNILIKTKRTKNNTELFKITEFLNSVTSNSFLRNNDGDGVYFTHKNKIVKSRSKLSFTKLKKFVKNSKFILTHQRMATSGLSDEFIHPFKNNEFVLVHNGVINDFCYKNNSDTYGFFKDFVKVFKSEQVLNNNREKNIIKTINKLLFDVNGSYSIALFDKKTEQLYYFKNDRTTIKFFINTEKSQLFLTTSIINPDYLDLYFENDIYTELEIKDYTIYKIRINKKNKISVCSVGKIKQQIKVTNYKPLKNIVYTNKPETEKEKQYKPIHTKPLPRTIDEYYNDEDLYNDGYYYGDDDLKKEDEYIKQLQKMEYI